jgi:hypothetical protein
VTEQPSVATGERRALGDLFEDIFLQPAGVEIGQAFIDPDRQQMRQGEHCVALDIAEMLGARHPAYDGGMGPAGAPQIEQQADGNARDHAEQENTAHADALKPEHAPLVSAAFAVRRRPDR